MRFRAAAAVVAATDVGAGQRARELHGRLTKPPGSLGVLEHISVQLAEISRQCPPPIPDRVVVAVFAADHGVVAEGVSAWPQEVTAQMVANFASGGAAINVLARQMGAELVVIDVGVATTPAGTVPGVLDRRVRAGTRNLAAEPALTEAETETAMDAGAKIAADAVAKGGQLLVTGEMGIGNTTAAAAVVSALTGTDPAVVVGPGAGSDATGMARKLHAVRAGLARIRPGAPATGVLAEVGGLEIAALSGFMIGGAAAGVPVLVDGAIAAAAAIAAVNACPQALPYLIAGHRSAEPCSSIALEYLGLTPLLDLRLRLGEGTGAVLAVPLVQAAAHVLAEMATFDEAGIPKALPQDRRG